MSSDNLSNIDLNNVSEDEEVLQGPNVDPKLWYVTKNLGTGRHQLSDDKFVTVIRPREEDHSAINELRGLLADELQVREDAKLPDLNRAWFDKLDDSSLIDVLLESIEFPHSVKNEQLGMLAPRYLHDESGQLHAAIRYTIKTFRIQGCPPKLIRDVTNLSITGMAKWHEELQRRSPRFADSMRHAVKATGASELFWKKRLFRFMIVVLKLYITYQGFKDEFYERIIAEYLKDPDFIIKLLQDHGSILMHYKDEPEFILKILKTGDVKNNPSQPEPKELEGGEYNVT